MATQRTRPSPKVLLHLGDDVERLGNVESLARDAHRVVDQRQVALFELHVHHRAR